MSDLFTVGPILVLRTPSDLHRPKSVDLVVEPTPESKDFFPYPFRALTSPQHYRVGGTLGVNYPSYNSRIVQRRQ